MPDCGGLRPHTAAPPGQLRHDGRHRVGEGLAGRLVEAAEQSVGQHHGPVYALQVRHICEEFDLWRRRQKELDRDIGGLLDAHEFGRLLTSIDGIGPISAARIIAILGDPVRFRSAGAFAAQFGVVPAPRQSGKGTGTRAATGFGNARLRRALWMTVLAAVPLHASPKGDARRSSSSWKDRKPVAADLRRFHRAPTADMADVELYTFEGKWAGKCASIASAWRRAWQEVIPFFGFDPATRKIIYTTNAMESLNLVIRKTINTRGSFATDDGATMLICLSIHSFERDGRNIREGSMQSVPSFADDADPQGPRRVRVQACCGSCLLYTSDAADE